MPFLNEKIDKINKINATTKIVGPDAVFISSEQNNPIITDAIPPIIEKINICIGLLLRFLAIAGGIKSNPVISKTPIIFIEIAITPARSKV